MTPASDSILRDPASIVSNGVVLLFVVVVFLSIIVVVHHLVTERQRRLNRLRFESAALTLAPCLVSLDRKLEREVPAARLRSGDRAVALVLRKVRYDLKGELADRASAILNEIGEVSRLLHEAKSRRDWRRLAAVRALGECGGARACKALMHAAAHDQSDEVRGAAREGLLQNGTEQAVRAAVESFLESPALRAGARHSFYIRLAAASEVEMAALVRSGRLPGAELKLALEAIGDVGRRSAIGLAKEHLMSADAEMRASAIRVIGKIGGEREMRMAIHALDDNEWYVRAAAARALEWLLSLTPSGADAPMRESARQRLRKHLTDPSWWVRANSARALAAAGEEGVELLRHAGESHDEPARDAARAVLAMLRTLPPNATLPPIPNLEIPSDFDPDLTIGERTFRPGGLRA